jgi:hypothetical protein
MNLGAIPRMQKWINKAQPTIDYNLTKTTTLPRLADKNIKILTLIQKLS